MDLVTGIFWLFISPMIPNVWWSVSQTDATDEATPRRGITRYAQKHYAESGPDQPWKTGLLLDHLSTKETIGGDAVMAGGLDSSKPWE